MNKLKLFNTIYSKVITICLVFCVVFFVAFQIVAKRNITQLEESLIRSRLEADINYIEDIISENKTGYWNIKDNAIYYGDILIGDGTEETANFEPFLEHQRKTETFAYVFMLDEDAELGYVEGDENSVGYEEGHYLRIAGSTKDPSGASIVGTYITKNVSDELDRTGRYYGEANVAGGMIYCIYHTLLNENGEIVGAIVVGRYITELKEQINASVMNMSVITFLIMFICVSCLTIMISRSIREVKTITDYIDIIESGKLPEYELSVNTHDEMELIAESINKMANALKENASLKRQSETDFLTKLPNRLAYNSYEIFTTHFLDKEPRAIAVEILDIDYFKQYNDNYGHQDGDEVIIKVANVIHEIVKENHNIFGCRFGGDEFVIVYQGYSKNDVINLAKSLKKRVELCNIRHEYSKISNKVTVTQGICYAKRLGGYSISELLKKADEVLYSVKQRTRNDYSIIEVNKD